MTPRQGQRGLFDLCPRVVLRLPAEEVGHAEHVLERAGGFVQDGRRGVGRPERPGLLDDRALTVGTRPDDVAVVSCISVCQLRDGAASLRSATCARLTKWNSQGLGFTHYLHTHITNTRARPAQQICYPENAKLTL